MAQKVTFIASFSLSYYPSFLQLQSLVNSKHRWAFPHLAGTFQNKRGNLELSLIMSILGTEHFENDY